MPSTRVLSWLLLVALGVTAGAPQSTIAPQVRNRIAGDNKITEIVLEAHFVTTIRVPEPVNSVVVGDPALFQVEHSEREPELVFVKALTDGQAQSNLLISTTKGHQISLLLVSRSDRQNPTKVDFLVRYHPSGGFLVEPDALPFALISPTARLSQTPAPASAGCTAVLDSNQHDSVSLDTLLDRQKRASLPVLYGERMEPDQVKGDRLRAGVSEVLDGGQQVIVLFSVVNTSKNTILLMPPQVQLGGQDKSGKFLKHEHWSTAEQLPVVDFRLGRRRIGPGERADGVVLFDRPPYKRSMETLFLQMAESGAVDRPALAPIGFGISTLREATNRAH